MANTVTQRTLVGSGADRKIVRHIHVISDGTQETDTVVYDNSAFVNNVSKGSLIKIWLAGAVSSTTDVASTTTKVRLEWDQSTDSPAISLNPQSSECLDFCEFGGIHNPNGTGATGDLLLTTLGLSSGDEFTLVIEIKQ